MKSTSTPRKDSDTYTTNSNSSSNNTTNNSNGLQNYPRTPDPYGFSSTSAQSTPSSEKRQRKTLLIQKQRQIQQHQHHQQQQSQAYWQSQQHPSSPKKALAVAIGSDISTPPLTSPLSGMLGNSQNSNNDSYANLNRSLSGSFASTSENTRRRNSSSSTSSTTNTTTSSSRRMRRFVSAMGMAAVFCLLVIFREQAFSIGSNQKFEVGSTTEQRHGEPSTAKQSTSQSNKSSKSSTQAKENVNSIDSSRTNPMQALGGLIGWSKNNKNNQQQGQPKHPFHSSDDTPYKSPIDEHPESHGILTSTSLTTAATTQSEFVPAQSESSQTKPQPPQEQQEENLPQQSEPVAQEQQEEEPLDKEQSRPSQSQSQSQTPPKQSRPMVSPKPIPPAISYNKAAYDPSMQLQEPQFPQDSTNNNSFVRRHCNLQGTDWFPIKKDISKNHTASNSNSAARSWNQRAPAALLLGPSHGGSDIVFQLLASHPQIADAIRTHFFTHTYKKFVSNINNKPISSTSSNVTSSITPSTISSVENNVRVKTRSARMFYTAGHVNIQRQLQKNHHQIVIDNVRETLLYEQIMAPFVFCTMPWIKLLIVVQDPIQRLLQHYQAAQGRGLTMTLEDWIARDLERMQQAGLILRPPQSTKSQTEFEQQAKQTLANHDFWIQYQLLTSHSMEASAGQSLYEAMIHPWFTWLQQMGRNPASEIIVIQKEVLLKDETSLRQEYSRIIQQLGLVPHTPPKALVESILNQQQQQQGQQQQQQQQAATTGDEEAATVRKQMQRFFQPYNAIFDEFLQSVYPPETLEQFWNPQLWDA